jgi:hypothetical protein
MEMRRGCIVLICVIGLALAGSTSAGAAKRSSAKNSVTVQQVVLRVNPCSIESGTESGGPIWLPTQLTAQIPPALKSKVELYSTGTNTVLAPAGWVCSALEATDGGTSLVVSPPGQASSQAGASAPNSSNVTALFDYTGHGPGMDLVCPYFPPPDPQSYSGCSTSLPAGQTTKPITADILSISTAPTAKQSRPSTGVLIYPKVRNYENTSVDIAEETCTLSTPSLCPTLLSDFAIRDFPIPVPSQ